MNDFNLWRKKVRALLVKEGLDSALEEASYSTSDEATTSKSGQKDWDTIQKKAHSTLFLALSDEVLRKVGDEETALGL